MTHTIKEVAMIHSLEMIIAFAAAATAVILIKMRDPIDTYQARARRR